MDKRIRLRFLEIGLTDLLKSNKTLLAFSNELESIDKDLNLYFRKVRQPLTTIQALISLRKENPEFLETAEILEIIEKELLDLDKSFKELTRELIDEME